MAGNTEVNKPRGGKIGIHRVEPDGTRSTRARFAAQLHGTLPWILAILPFVALLAWFWTAGDGPTMDDNGQYLMQAEALLEGQPFTQTNYVTDGYQLAVQPPGLPVTLAAVMALTGGYHAVAIKLAMILSALPFIVLPGL